MYEMMMGGLELMVSGMLIVFMFLAMLVIAVNVLRVLVEHFFPEPVVTEPSEKSYSQQQSGVIAAITVAVTQYRKKHHQDS